MVTEQALFPWLVWELWDHSSFRGSSKLCCVQRVCQNLLEILLISPLSLMFLADVTCGGIAEGGEKKNSIILMVCRKHINMDKRFCAVR